MALGRVFADKAKSQGPFPRPRTTLARARGWGPSPDPLVSDATNLHGQFERRPDRGDPPEAPPVGAATVPAVAFDFARTPIYRPPTGSTGEVATDRAIRMPATTPGVLQPKFATRQKKEEMIQHQGENAAVMAAPPSVHEALRSPGQPLDPGTRALVEPRLGHDFSQVRVHTDTTAAESARHIHAHAYTLGRHIVFARGRYAPTTTEGRRLVGHELAHVVQQAAGRVASSPTQRGEVPIAANRHLEDEADASGEKVARGELAPVPLAAPLGVATQLKAQGEPLQRDADGSGDGSQVALPTGPTTGAKDTRTTGSTAPAKDSTPSTPAQTGPHTGPTKIASGAKAMETLKWIPSQQPLTVSGGSFGDVTLVPGANMNRKILVVAAPQRVLYIDGIDLFEASTSDFVRDIWLTAFAQGAARAEWLIPIIKAEFAFLEAFFGSVRLVVGLSILEWIVFYNEHKEQFHRAVASFGTFYHASLEFKRRYPTLYKKALVQALKKALLDAPDGITAADVAYLLGRILGTHGLLEAQEEGVELTVKVVGNIIARYVGLVGLVHAPGIIGRGLEANASTGVEELQEALASTGIQVTHAEARTVLRELAADSGAKEFLEQFKGSAEDLQQAMRVLQQLH
jgi:hypothetical protein